MFVFVSSLAQTKITKNLNQIWQDEIVFFLSYWAWKKSLALILIWLQMLDLILILMMFLIATPLARMTILCVKKIISLKWLWMT